MASSLPAAGHFGLALESRSRRPAEWAERTAQWQRPVAARVHSRRKRARVLASYLPELRSRVLVVSPLGLRRINWTLGANRRRVMRSQVAVLGCGEDVLVSEAEPATRFMLMAGKPYGEAPIYNGPFVD